MLDLLGVLGVGIVRVRGWSCVKLEFFGGREGKGWRWG
jgi:hypothetical protein